MKPSKFKLAEKIIMKHLKENYDRDHLYLSWVKKGLIRFIPPFGLKDMDVLDSIYKLAKEKSWRELKEFYDTIFTKKE